MPGVHVFSGRAVLRGYLVNTSKEKMIVVGTKIRRIDLMNEDGPVTTCVLRVGTW